MYTINDVDNVLDATGISYRIAPNPNILHQMWHFIQLPSDIRAYTLNIIKIEMIGMLIFI